MTRYFHMSAIHAQLALVIKAHGASNGSAIHTPNAVYESDGGRQTSGDCQMSN